MHSRPGTNLQIATVGTAAGVNNYPAAESPDHAIDGVGAKYLNFFKTDSGFMTSPTFNGGLGSAVNGITLWTANDSPERDPSTVSIYGTNSALNGAGMLLSAFTPIVLNQALALPASRNAGGAAVLDPLNSQTINFATATGYKL